MRIFFLADYCFHSSQQKILDIIPDLAQAHNRLNLIETRILGSAAANTTTEQLTDNLAAFSQNLESPRPDSIEGQDLLRRHGQIYSFLSYLLGLTGIAIVSLHSAQSVQSIFAGLSTLTHLFVYRYLLILLSPWLIAREFKRFDNLLVDYTASFSDFPSAFSLKNGPAIYQGNETVPNRFDALFLAWEQLLNSAVPPQAEKLDTIAAQLTSVIKTTTLSWKDFRSNLNQYHRIRDLSRKTVEWIDGETCFHDYFEFFALWSIYANEIWLSMARFAEIDVLKGKFIPPYVIPFLNIPIGEPFLRGLHFIFGLTFRYHLARNGVLHSIEKISHLQHLINVRAQKLLGEKYPQNGSTDPRPELINSFRMIDNQYRHPAREGLVGRYYYQRVFDICDLSFNLMILLTMVGVKILHPQAAAIRLMGFPVIKTSAFLYLIFYWIRPTQAYIEVFREYTHVQREIRSQLEHPHHQNQGPLTRIKGALASLEHFVYGCSYILAFLKPYLSIFIVLVQLTLMPKNYYQLFYPEDSPEKNLEPTNTIYPIIGEQQSADTNPAHIQIPVPLDAEQPSTLWDALFPFIRPKPTRFQNIFTPIYSRNISGIITPAKAAYRQKTSRPIQRPSLPPTLTSAIQNITIALPSRVSSANGLFLRKKTPNPVASPSAAPQNNEAKNSAVIPQINPLNTAPHNVNWSEITPISGSGSAWQNPAPPSVQGLAFVIENLDPILNFSNYLKLFFSSKPLSINAINSAIPPGPQ
ncbi:MAG: hypothetical protein HQL23_03145 [Candidatus Omnitrophica bacterium]|nr:hypothetical protein [Candidatus Omnitrophota bacterium]